MTVSPSARDIYFDLFSGQRQSGALDRAERFLSSQLAKADSLLSDLPDSPDDLEAWMQAGVEQVGQQYAEYLEARQAGGKRRYFRSHAHALNFLKSVAPTKMVDGAWLYGLLPRWQDPRFTHLIRTYLEELGEGLPAKNHVTLYKKLLQAQGCEQWDDLSDDHYVQGALQLALAYQADQFLPEVIGFNLGYEQLPLHLLITAYELKELGIDPYYFTLHITVDNADSGHAKKAVEAVFEAMPRVGDSQTFYRRVRSGYNLNLLGASTLSVIESFDLEKEMMAVFARKASIGQYVHSDYRLIAGRTVNDWLSDPAQIPAFVAAMEESGWFKRHQDPENSRFWKLIQSEKAKMFGVFSAYEQQVIHDWIVGDAADRLAGDLKPVRPSRLPFDVKQRLREEMSGTATRKDDDFDAEVRALEENLSTDREAVMATLIGLMSPTLHHTASGLAATRMFNEILD
ncbi:MAG: iron-containing redox enzyme family protein [Armatimonadota bacterium]